MTSYMDRSAGGPGTSDTLSAELDHPLRTMLGAERVSVFDKSLLHFIFALCPSTVSRNTTEFYLRFLLLFLLSRPSYPACRFLYIHTSCRSSPHPAACRHTAVRETPLTDTAHNLRFLLPVFFMYIFCICRSHRTPHFIFASPYCSQMRKLLYRFSGDV